MINKLLVGTLDSQGLALVSQHRIVIPVAGTPPRILAGIPPRIVVLPPMVALLRSFILPRNFIPPHSFILPHIKALLSSTLTLAHPLDSHRLHTHPTN